MPNFMLVSLNARFLLKIDLICLANWLIIGYAQSDAAVLRLI